MNVQDNSLTPTDMPLLWSQEHPLSGLKGINPWPLTPPWSNAFLCSPTPPWGPHSFHTPSSFSSSCPFVQLEAGSKRGFNAFTAERTWTAPGFYVRLQTFSGFVDNVFSSRHINKESGWWSQSQRLSRWLVFIWDDENILKIRVIHFKFINIFPLKTLTVALSSIANDNGVGVESTVSIGSIKH